MGQIKNIIDHKAGFCRPLQGNWSEQAAHDFAQNECGLKPHEYTLEGESYTPNESHYWPD